MLLPNCPILKALIRTKVYNLSNRESTRTFLISTAKRIIGADVFCFMHFEVNIFFFVIVCCGGPYSIFYGGKDIGDRTREDYFEVNVICRQLCLMVDLGTSPWKGLP